MIKRLLFIFVLLFLSFGMMAQSSVYNYEVIDSEGQTVNLGKSSRNRNVSKVSTQGTS